MILSTRKGITISTLFYENCNSRMSSIFPLVEEIHAQFVRCARNERKQKKNVNGVSLNDNPTNVTQSNVRDVSTKFSIPSRKTSIQGCDIYGRANKTLSRESVH